MLVDIGSTKKIYIACGYTDMRRSIDGLCAIVKLNFKIDPFSKSLFLFCGRRRDRIKALFWDGDGFILLYKRLENSNYKWPRRPEEVRCLTQQEFRWLMEGLSIEQPRAIKGVNRGEIF